MLFRRPKTLRSNRVWVTLLGVLVLAAILGSLALTGVFSSNETSPRVKQTHQAVSAKTLRALEGARRRPGQPPLYYLGLSFDGLPLIYAENVDSTATFTYADCSVREINTFDPSCRRVITIDLARPAPGEITTQGRCTYSSLVRGATTALFPVNPQSLRIFTRGSTIYVSSRSLRDDLAAAQALRGLNVSLVPSQPLPARDVRAQLGHCRPAKKQPPLTAKQRYEQKMQQSWTLASASTVNLPDIAYADDRSMRAFLASVDAFPPLLRNEAIRVSGVRPPTKVADLQAKLVTELRAYADDVDLLLEFMRSGAWRDKSTYASKRKELEARFERHSKTIVAIDASFRKRGYIVARKLED